MFRSLNVPNKKGKVPECFSLFSVWYLISYPLPRVQKKSNVPLAANSLRITFFIISIDVKFPKLSLHFSHARSPHLHAVSNVNPQKRILLSEFFAEMEQCERLTNIYNKEQVRKPSPSSLARCNCLRVPMYFHAPCSTVL